MRISLNQERRIDSMVITNTADTEITLQLETVQWEQQGEQEVYTSTRDILATPPIIRIPAKSKQTIRIGIRDVPTSQVEQTYRLFLHEILPDNDPNFRGLKVALRIGVPVFITSSPTAQAELAWHAARTKEGQLELKLTNNGTAHVQILQIKLDFIESNTTHIEKRSTYVLPQHGRSWLVNTGTKIQANKRLYLSAETDIGTIDQELIVEQQ